MSHSSISTQSRSGGGGRIQTFKYHGWQFTSRCAPTSAHNAARPNANVIFNERRTRISYVRQSLDERLPLFGRDLQS